MFVRTMIVIYSEQRIRHYVYNIYKYTGFSFSNEAGGEWPFASGDNLGVKRPF